ncbi:MAG: PHP domain-containing protein [Christensenellales bacterium]|nr:PHP domain-containing protein [Christensenellales bacterium]
MPKSREELLCMLNGENALAHLKALMISEPAPQTGRDVNNHIHTTYSFSPYSPAAAVWFARQAGLCTCGLMDHDSIAGAKEFLDAAKIAGMAATIGMECRVSFKNTPFADRKLNNPDQIGVMYMAIHGVPHDRAEELNLLFAPYREKRNQRNRRMVEAINGMMGQYGVTIDFEKDVLPLSNYASGGSVTERHLSSALAYKLLEVIGSGERLIRFIKDEVRLPLSSKIEGYLLDENNPHRMYDLLGWIKSQLISRFYIDADEELPDVREALELADRIGAIAAMAYLGDVGDSVTGDKRAQKFEDDYLDELIAYVSQLGFKAVTYMPSRNTRQQLTRLRGLCEQYGLFQISGEDINSPRQSFVCEAQRDPEFSNLYDATWALIAHEWRATENPADGFFSPESIARWPDLNDRIRAFAQFGQAMQR